MERDEFLALCKDFGLDPSGCHDEWYEDYLHDCGFERCDICGEWVDADYSRWIEDEYTMVCENCLEENYFCCDDCGEWHSRDKMIRTANDEHICEDCYTNSYFTCEECGEVYHIDYGVWTDNGYVCEDCYAVKYENSLIYEYHDYDFGYRPRGIANNNLYMGIELEYNGARNTAEDFHSNDIGDVFHFEEDGSISGYECISQPCSLEYWKSYENTLKKCLDSIKNGNYTSDNTGFHIHLSRKAFADEKALYHFIAYVNSFKGDFEKLANRDGNSWCAYDEDRKTVEDMEVLGFSYDRYKAVNTNNRDTIEVRLFRSSLDSNYIVNVLQVLSNLVEKANNHIKSLRFNELFKNTDADFAYKYLNNTLATI